MPFTCPSGPRGMRADPAGNRRPFGGRSPGWGLSLGGQRDEKGGTERWERGPGEVGKGVKRDVQGGLLGTKHSKDRASPPSPNVWHPWETPWRGGWLQGGVTSSGRAKAQRGVPPGFHGAVSIFICVPFCGGGESDEAGKRA